MRTFSWAAFFCICLGVAAARPNEQKAKIERRESITIAPNKGMMGIASLAGIASRNGRLSSLTGVKLLPTMDSVSLSSDGAPFFYPLTVTKEGDGKFASGSIQFFPGSVMVSSSAKSGYGPELKSWPKMDMPIATDVFLPPLDLFSSPRNLDPWFPKDIFKPIPPPQMPGLDTWLYPRFNPFVNLWR